MQNKHTIEFRKKYLDPYYVPDWGKINISEKNSIEHNLMVATICCHLKKHKIPYLTEAKFKGNKYISDICVPFGLPFKIIEVRASETDKQTNKKKLPEELRNEVVYIDAYETFRFEQLL